MVDEVIVLKEKLRLYADQYGKEFLKQAYDSLMLDLKQGEIKARLQDFKKKGLVFESLDDYLKKEHSDKKGFLSIKRDYKIGEPDKYYLIQKTDSATNRIPIKIYECEDCGVVKGSPEQRCERNPFDPLLGGFLNHFHCIICEKEL